jgi:hypothetical protein
MKLPSLCRGMLLMLSQHALFLIAHVDMNVIHFGSHFRDQTLALLWA